MSKRKLVVQIASIILLLTGSAKLWSSFGPSPILSYHDPLLLLIYRDVFRYVGSAELLVGSFLLVKPNASNAPRILIGIGSCFALYRIGASILHIERCPCLGTLTDSIPMNPRTINWLLMGAVAYMIVGGLLASRWEKQQNPLNLQCNQTRA